MRLLLLSLLVATVTSVAFANVNVGHRVLDDSWELYKIKYNKKYGSLGEEMKRRMIWEENLHFISKHNLKEARGESTFTLGQGPFTDLTLEEYKARVQCLRLPSKPSNTTPKKQVNVKDLPGQVDWRQQGVVTGVKNQGQCNDCWAFGSVGTTESRTAMATGNLYSLSEQQIIDCDTNNHGCDPGYPDYAVDYIASNGLESDSTYPYQAVAGNCNYDAGQVVARISNRGDVQGLDGMMDELANRGPVAVFVDSESPYWRDYNGGIMDNTACSPDTDHVVTAVGYVNQGGESYWILKNSWGEGWGESGYIRLGLGQNVCGVESHGAVFANV